MKTKHPRAFPQVCALCGCALSRSMQFMIFDNNMPGACATHLSDVLIEVEKNDSMWPSDWAGRSWKNPDGRWNYE
jgi:hypothetical protein